MKSNTRSRVRPPIEPIRTNHGQFNDLSKRLIPVRGESPSNSPEHASSPGSAQADTSARIPGSATHLPPLSASFFARRGVYPDAFIIPVELPRQLRSSLRPSTRNGQLVSPLPNGGSFTVRVVVHSNNRHFGLTRQFNVDTLRATIPDGTSPRTPTLDQGFSLAVLEGDNTFPLPESPIEAETHQNLGSAISPDSGSSPLTEREVRLGYRALPIDIHYARAHLPVLASIMMSNQVRRGNTIELPMPHPNVWKNTIMYIYTGNEDFATKQVKRNILYLGGRL